MRGDMAGDIVLSNLDPNQIWYAKISDQGANALIELFNSAADANAGTNRVAYASFDFGVAVEVTLTNDTTEPDIELFCSDDEWHLMVTMQSGDDTIIIQFGPFTDKPEILDPLLASSQARIDRARREIDAGTHIEISRVISLNTHIQGLEPGDTRKLKDNARGLDQSVRIDEITITGDKDSLKTVLKTVEYDDVTR